MPSYTPIWALAGTAVGSLLTVLTTWWRERSHRQQSTRAVKRDEYRQLLDSLGECVNSVIAVKQARSPKAIGLDIGNQLYLHSSDAEERKRPLTSALLGAWRTLENRLYIEEELNKHSIGEKWKKLEVMAWLPTHPSAVGQEAFNETQLSQAWAALASEIREIAREDTR